MRERAVLVALTMTVIAVLGVLGFTMGPRPDGIVDAIAIRLTPGASVADRQAMGATVELGLNVLLFVPVGFALAAGLGPRRWWLAATVGVVLSAGVELAQGTSFIGRTPSTNDLIMNSTGAVLGAMVLAAAVGGVRVARVALQRA